MLETDTNIIDTRGDPRVDPVAQQNHEPPARNPLYPSYSPTDVKCVIQTNRVVVVNPELVELSYSVYREKVPARPCGFKSPRSYTRGPMTAAGTLVFAVFDRMVLWDILKDYQLNPLLAHDEANSRSALLNEIPPFNMDLTFVNEYGSVSRMGITGIEILDESMQIGMSSSYQEVVTSYVASNILPLEPYSINGPTGEEWNKSWTLKTRPLDIIEDAMYTIRGEQDPEDLTALNYVGNRSGSSRGVKSCPRPTCGKILPANTERCPECGHYFGWRTTAMEGEFV